jgi:hypothetical protein
MLGPQMYYEARVGGLDFIKTKILISYYLFIL